MTECSDYLKSMTTIMHPFIYLLDKILVLIKLGLRKISMFQLRWIDVLIGIRYPKEHEMSRNINMLPGL